MKSNNLGMGPKSKHNIHFPFNNSLYLTAMTISLISYIFLIFIYLFIIIILLFIRYTNIVILQKKTEDNTINICRSYHDVIPIVDWHTDELPGRVWRQRRRRSGEPVSEAAWPSVWSTSIVSARDRIRLTPPHAWVPWCVFSWKIIKYVNENN